MQNRLEEVGRGLRAACVCPGASAHMEKGLTQPVTGLDVPACLPISLAVLAIPSPNGGHPGAEHQTSVGGSRCRHSCASRGLFLRVLMLH